MKMVFKSAGIALLVAAFWACSSESDKLPIYGERETVNRTVDGKTVVDTVYHRIPDFAFTNQDGQPVTGKTLDGKIYVTDFFFTTCPTICPKMKTQMKRVYEKFKGNPEVMILSHTIDPRHDTPQVLKEFAIGLGVTDGQWQFVTGEKEKLFAQGKTYMVVAQDDSAAPGGLLHSGHFVLVDKDKHVRGMYDGTTEQGVNKLMSDMEKLLAEYKK